MQHDTPQPPSSFQPTGWRVRGSVGALAVAGVLYLFFALTTARPADFGTDGRIYAFMAEHFAFSRVAHLPPVPAPYHMRYLAPAIAHYVHPDPFLAFRCLNACALLGVALAFYGLARWYRLPSRCALVGLALYLVTWPALRCWVYYPVLLDPMGHALLLTAIWATLTKRYLWYTLSAAALMPIRENGAVLIVFFALVHANPWNPCRDRDGRPLPRTLRLVAWNLLPLLSLAHMAWFPLFPRDSHYTYTHLAAAVDSLKALWTADDKRLHWLVAMLNTFGLLPYALGWWLVEGGARRVVSTLRSHLHWVWYVATALLFAPLSYSDQERFLLLAVPPLVLALLRGMGDAPARPWTWIGWAAVLLMHAWLTNAFAPLQTHADYSALWATFMPRARAAHVVTTHAWLCLCAVTLVALRRLLATRLRIARLTLALLGVAVALAGAEYTLTRWGPPLPLAELSLDNFQRSPNPELVYELRPGAPEPWSGEGADARINSGGFRDVERSVRKPPRTVRLMVIGDSLAYGYYVRRTDTYAARLETLLNARASSGLRYEVLNCGVPGYKLSQTVAWFRAQGLRYAPDLVIVGYWFDDVTDSDAHWGRFFRDTERADQADALTGFLGDEAPARTLRRCLLRSALVRRAIVSWHRLHFVLRRARLLAHRAAPANPQPPQTADHASRLWHRFHALCADRVRTSGLPPLAETYYAAYDDRGAFDAWVGAFAQLQALTQSRQIPVVLVLTPVLYDLDHYQWQELHTFLQEVGQHFQMGVVDLLDAFRGVPLGALRIGREDDEHFSAHGHALVAQALVAYLDAQRLLPEEE